MYPASRAARDRFILDRRAARPQHDPWRFQDLMVEEELTVKRTLAPTATVFLTGRECAWRCVMCDLWRYTTTGDTPRGAIPTQIASARGVLDASGHTVSQMKLYNASNFFDPQAVPDEDYQAIAATLKGLDRIIVESHPALIGSRVDRFLDALCRAGGQNAAALEVAMGLETANPDALERLNKGLTLGQFSEAAEALRTRNVALRVFLLISPPFIPPAEQDRWLLESIDRATACGAVVVSLIPTRAGNGAMEGLADAGLFRQPDLLDIERSAELALAATERARIFIDLWDLQRFSRCRHCFATRRDRLHTMNLEQRACMPISCAHCGHGQAA
jgi:archaeosine synthase beta-subunit